MPSIDVAGSPAASPEKTLSMEREASGALRSMSFDSRHDVEPIPETAFGPKALLAGGEGADPQGVEMWYWNKEGVFQSEVMFCNPIESDTPKLIIPLEVFEKMKGTYKSVKTHKAKQKSL